MTKRLEYCEFCMNHVARACGNDEVADGCNDFAIYMQSIAEEYNLDPVGEFLEEQKQRR